VICDMNPTSKFLARGVFLRHALRIPNLEDSSAGNVDESRRKIRMGYWSDDAHRESQVCLWLRWRTRSSCKRYRPSQSEVGLRLFLGILQRNWRDYTL
jgi:hypothetical protein